MRFWALAISLLPALAGAEAFGRFGYNSAFTIPGLTLDKGGFRAKTPGATAFRFDQPSTYWKVVETTAARQSVSLSGKPWCPAKARQDLTSPGFQLFVERGISLRLSSSQAPFLSWSSGSVGPDVATAPAKWVLVSFRAAQPPLLIGFMDQPEGLTVTGKAGDWRIRSSASYKGWIRVALPFGLAPRPTASAATLGALTRAVGSFGNLWSDPSPVLQSLSVRGDEASVTATWTYDRPGAVVPNPVILAPISWYRLTTSSNLAAFDGYTEEGPQVVQRTTELSVRFPARRMPTGRAVTQVSATDAPIASASSVDPRSVTELALATLLAAADEGVQSAAQSTAAEFLESLPAIREPNSGQSLPFLADGTGMDVVAAQAVMKSARHTAGFDPDAENSFLTSLTWRRDALTWRLASAPSAVSRRASALAAIAGCISGTDAARLEAGLFEAGLAAEEALPTWLNRRGYKTAAETPLQVMPGLRKLLLGRTTLPGDDGEYRALLSPLRILGFGAFFLQGTNLNWNARSAGTFGFSLVGPLDDVLPVLNLSAIRISTVGPLMIDCDIKAMGPCQAALSLKPGVGLPPLRAWPGYRE